MPDPVENATDTTTATTEGTSATTTAATTSTDASTATATTEGTDTATTTTKPAEGEGGTPEDKSKEEGKTAAPENYEPFAMPEGVELDQAAVDRAAPVLKEIGLSQEQAQKLVDFYAPELQARIAEAAEKAVTPEVLGQYLQVIDQQRDEEWIAAVKADPEIGGAKLDETKALALKGIEAFGTPALKEALVQTRLGNHPELIRMFARIGALTKEDRGGLPAGGGAAPRSLAERMYPNGA